LDRRSGNRIKYYEAGDTTEYSCLSFPALLIGYRFKFLALTTETGGSAIIIGSAVGVAAMGIEKIEFMWYLKKIAWLALIGFVAGIAVFLLQVQLTS